MEQIPAHYVGTAVLFVLGMAFLLIWLGDRLNQMSRFWAIAYFALSFASVLGYRYQNTGEPLLGAIAVTFTGLYIMAMYAANTAVDERPMPIFRLLFGALAITLLVALVGFGYSQWAGRALVQLVMVLLFGWSAWIFYRKFAMPFVGSVFLIKSLVLVANFGAGDKISTAALSLWYTVPNWASTIFLALVLVFLAIKQSRNRLDKVLGHLPDAVVARRKDGRIMFCNKQFADFAGVKSRRELKGKYFHILVGDKASIQNKKEPLELLANAGVQSDTLIFENWVYPVDAPPFEAEVIYSCYFEYANAVIVTQIRDITQRKIAEAERLQMASTDQLTGLYNRQGFELRLSSILWELHRTGGKCALMMFDIRDFKRVNDVVGIHSGDELLKEFARLLQSHFNSRDLLARLGSDEFVAVIPDLQSNEAVIKVVHSVQTLLASFNREVNEGSYTLLINANAGIAFNTEELLSPSTFMHRAQLALYEAKARGVNEYQIYEDGFDSKYTNNILIESSLRKALYTNELMLYYQPIIDSTTGRAAKVEALIRWNSASLGFMSPADFIPIAEQSDLIVDLGRWIMRTAFLQAKAWRSQSANAPVIGINVSVRQFLQKNFEKDVLRLVQEIGIEPSWVDFELTESLFAGRDKEQLQLLLNRIRSEGFGLSLDDFGTGYSSLSYLAEFRLSAVKIDRSFVSELDKDSKKRSIVKAIISMGHNLGLQVVAEGVETSAEYACLLEDKCDLLQGYWFSKPIPPEALTKLEFIDL